MGRVLPFRLFARTRELTFLSDPQSVRRLAVHSRAPDSRVIGKLRVRRSYQVEYFQFGRRRVLNFRQEEEPTRLTALHLHPGTGSFPVAGRSVGGVKKRVSYSGWCCAEQVGIIDWLRYMDLRHATQACHCQPAPLSWHMLLPLSGTPPLIITDRAMTLSGCCLPVRPGCRCKNNAFLLCNAYGFLAPLNAADVVSDLQHRRHGCCVLSVPLCTRVVPVGLSLTTTSLYDWCAAYLTAIHDLLCPIPDCPWKCPIGWCSES